MPNESAGTGGFRGYLPAPLRPLPKGIRLAAADVVGEGWDGSSGQCTSPGLSAAGFIENGALVCGEH